MSLGTVVLGVLNGLTVGLLATGLVLVYKSNRFINLAHAQMGTLSALLLAKWVLDWHWPWWPALAAALVVSSAVSLLVERFLVRRLRRQRTAPVRLLFLTVGVSQLLLALTFVPSLGPNQNKSSALQYPEPFDAHLRIGLVVLNGMSLLTMVLVPILVLGLALFVKYTTIGKQVRAAATNSDAARACGISVDRVSAITWGIAGSLAAVSAILQAPTQPSFNAASFGPYLLMMTLGAAAFGGFSSLPWALVGGICLGLLNQVVGAVTSDATKAELASFVLILAVVLVRGGAIKSVFSASEYASADARHGRRSSRMTGDGARVSNYRYAVLGLAFAVSVVFPYLPYFDTSGHRFLLSLIVIYAVIGVALNMLIGWAGQVSLGHFALVGVAAYLTARWAPHGWALPELLLAAGVIGGAVMVAVGLPALRVPGLALVVTSLGFGVVAQDWLFHQSWLVSTQPFGLAVTSPRLARGLGTPSSQLAIYFVALVLLTITVSTLTSLRHSSAGRLMLAVRDNERAASTFGVTPATVKLAALGLSGAFVAMAGVLWADAWQIVSPSQFSADTSLSILAIPVIGGLGSLSGAVAAAVLLYGSTFFVGPLVAPVFGTFGQNLGFQLFLAGGAVVLTLMAYPSGLAGFAADQWRKHVENRTTIDSTSIRNDISNPLALRPELRPATTDPPAVVFPVSTNGLAKRDSPVAGGYMVERSMGERAVASSTPLVVSGLSVRFGGVVALDNVTIDVRPSEIVGLIGPNGAGKTTLMNVVSGVTKPAAGSVQVFGNEVADLPPDIRSAYGLARSFQDAGLFPGLTVTETVQVALARGRKVGYLPALLAAPWVRANERWSESQSADIVRRFGLDEWREVFTAELSTGTRRICDLAAQVASEPQILLLDEPTAGVAQRDAEAFGPLLRSIRDELGCAVLLVEHDMPLLMGLCDRVYAMEAGRVIAEGDPATIRNDPAVVSSYLGTTEIAIARSGSRQDSGRRPSLRSTTSVKS